MSTMRSSSARRRRRSPQKVQDEYIAPGFTTAAQAEREDVEDRALGLTGRTGCFAVLSAVISIVDTVLGVPFAAILVVFETFYGGLQLVLVPVAKLVPRNLLGVDWFTANSITFGRLFLVIPVAIGLAYGTQPLLPGGGWVVPFVPGIDVAGPGTPMNRLPGVILASLLIMYHDFLDHVDGIVAVAQREAGTAAGDDPLFGGFIDAFVDKVFFAITIWTTLLCTDMPAARTVINIMLGASQESLYGAIANYAFGLEAFVVLAAVLLVAYEVMIATVRVTDYFTEKLAPPTDTKTRRRLRAAMEGKLKQKMTSFGLAFLALAVPSLAAPVLPYSAVAGAWLLLLACFMAHKSLAHKLEAYPEWRGLLPAGKAAL